MNINQSKKEDCEWILYRISMCVNIHNMNILYGYLDVVKDLQKEKNWELGTSPPQLNSKKKLLILSSMHIIINKKFSKHYNFPNRKKYEAKYKHKEALSLKGYSQSLCLILILIRRLFSFLFIPILIYCWLSRNCLIQIIMLMLP